MEGMVNDMYGITRKSVKKVVSEMKSGESIYINAISLTPSAISQIRTLIKFGTLIPDKDEASKMYNDVDSVMNGSVILPQMTYIKA